MENKYDSTADTLQHIRRVNEFMGEAAMQLIRRGIVHDASKLESPEKELFDEFTPKLKESEYGSDEYKENLKGLKVALEHHYAMNSHHPECHVQGVDDMDLFDLIEMVNDWKAATERHPNGDFLKSLEINKTRFKLSDQLFNIIKRHYERYLQS